MINRRQRSAWRSIALVALAATVLGGAYVGFQSGGGRTTGIKTGEGSPPLAGNSVKASGAVKTPSGDDETEDEDEEWSLHDRLVKFFAEGDDSALDGLKPRGITDIEGTGGKGLNKQVKSHGVWYPVFNLSKAGNKDGELDTEDPSLEPGKISLAEIPLSIASPNPPAGVISQAFSYRFAAVGGAPPYRWMMQLGEGAQNFVLDPASGLLAGKSDQPLSTTMNVFVSDTEGGQASAMFALVISPDTPLNITTTSLPLLEMGKPYQATLTGEGGVPPYTWAISSTAPALQCDPATGMLSGTAAQAGAITVQVTLTDAQQTTVEKTLELQASEGLTITTESPLPPATPAADYSLTFEASGGTPPFVWSVVGGTLPDGWRLVPEGALTGRADKKEGLYHFDIQVKDSNGLSYRQAYDLPVMQPLTVVPSRNRAGLAWQPKVMARVLAAAPASVSVTRSTGGGAAVQVYSGNASNFVDHNLVTGATYDYQLTAHTVTGRAVVFGKARVQILPMSLQRAVAGSSGDPYVDRVRAFNPLAPYGYGADGLPFNVCGPPDGRSTFTPAYRPTEVVSLHARTGAGGSITLEFVDNIIELGPGPDFTVFENVMFQNGDPNLRYMEPAVVEVALFEGEWYRFPVNVNQPVKGKPDLTRPTYYVQGFAGINATTGGDPTNAASSGGDSFDANTLGLPGLTWIRFVRLVSTGDKAISDLNGIPVEHTAVNNALSGGVSSGFDLDAVSAVNY